MPPQDYRTDSKTLRKPKFLNFSMILRGPLTVLLEEKTIPRIAESAFRHLNNSKKKKKSSQGIANGSHLCRTGITVRKTTCRGHDHFQCDTTSSPYIFSLSYKKKSLLYCSSLHTILANESVWLKRFQRRLLKVRESVDSARLSTTANSPDKLFT